MKRPNYLNFALIWTMAAAVSVVLFIQNQDHGNLIRAGLFLAMGVFYFWMNKKHKKDQ